MGNKSIVGYVIGFADCLPSDIPASKVKAIIGVCEDYPVLTSENMALAFWMRDKYYTTLAACIRCIIPASKADGRFPGTRLRKTAKKITGAMQAAQADSGHAVQLAVNQDVINDAKNAICLTDSQQDAINKIINGAESLAELSNSKHIRYPLDTKTCVATLNACAASLNDVQVNDSSPFLLHGVTGSGKTEVYLRAIAHIISLGKQAIVLVPEIALTPQIVALFSARFGDAVAVTHSRLTAGERFHIWKQALDGDISLVIGPRSAVFTPFTRLGLIVIDEEHEHTYHSETTPKYDARAVAMKRGELSNVMVVLGSATPSLESYSRAIGDISEPYRLINMPNRINQTFPDVTILDMRKELTRGNTSLFAADFTEALAKTLAKGEQAILFLNRRGHSSFVSCRQCGYVMSCDHCRVNYTYHQGTAYQGMGNRQVSAAYHQEAGNRYAASAGSLICHYCGRGHAMPKCCPVCASVHIRQYGAGTQKVEEEINRLFPDAATLRMDMDTTKGKHGHARILESFRKEEASILIGTQMVAKGLDFPKVTLVCVVSADLSLFTGDFRAGEYTFQLLTQVAGRAGRSLGVKGQVFLQTYNPEHYALELARQADYEVFYAHEIALRRAMCYPPFSHVFCVMLSGPEEKIVIAALRKLWAIMDYCRGKIRNGQAPFELLGMSPAFVSKIKKQYRWKILIKHPEEEPLKAFVLYCIKKLKENDQLADISVHLTLDPVMLD